MSEAAQKKVQQMIDDNGIGMYPLSPLLLPTRRFNLPGPLVRPIHIIMSRLTRNNFCSRLQQVLLPILQQRQTNP